MEVFSWLLISDLHLKSSYTTWSQNVVLKDLVRDLEAQKSQYPPIRLVFLSGDLAHGGKSPQYELVESFLTDLLVVLGLTNTDVFVVPGNHDIDRDINQLAFNGARSQFTNAENVERILSSESERQLLLKRLSAFRAFQERFCPHLNSAFTEDGLAYFVQRTVGELPIGIVGLNSALACGDDHDKENVIIGDRPIIDVCEKIRGADVRLVVAMVHHPRAWLTDFDGRTFDSRLLPQCDILHRGHLHEAGVINSSTTMHTNCLTIAAGASYVWRQFQNSYSIVSLDIAAAQCETFNFEYNNHSGAYKLADSQVYSVQLRGELPGNTADLVTAIRGLSTECRRFSAYMAALVDGKASEIPLPMEDGIYFGSRELLHDVRSPEYKGIATAILQVRNLLRAFPASTSITDRVNAHANRFNAFAKALKSFAEVDKEFSADMLRRNSQYEKLCELRAEQPNDSFINALNQLAGEGDWDGLEAIARRYEKVDSVEVSRLSRVRLALALAHSDEVSKLQEAVSIVEAILQDPECAASDFELAFMIYRKLNRDDEAERVFELAISGLPSLPITFRQAGMKFALESGRTKIRELLIPRRNGGNNE
jgi:hypothetical protein